MKTFDVDLILDEDEYEHQIANAEVVTNEILKHAKKSGIGKAMKTAIRGAQITAVAINKTVRKHPYESVAAAAVLGFLCGMMISKARSHNDN